ncbi:MAG: shikimate kinase [Clostridia bacterium]|nr:shikimate kinase [Clostridia bacterium]
MINCENLRAGLIGRRLGHSFSPEIHSFLADYEYKLYEMEENEVASFLERCPLDALNVTIPYKKTVMPYLGYISDEAKRIGSVNTIIKKADGLYGYNTDYYGFSYMLKKSGIEITDKKVLILGSGGASVTVKAVLADMKAREIVVISRSGEDNYDNIERHSDTDVIVNTTPVGMYPDTGKSPVDLKAFPKLSGVLDLIYNPAQTRLLYDAKSLGIPYINGLSMLVAQGKRAAELFTGEHIPDGEIEKIISAIENKTKNIVLIGMPGAGKTTIGKILAEKLGRKFIDTDDLITEKAGMPIPGIFSLYGEDRFREIETQALAEAGKTSGTVIATGGGIVTRAENRYSVKQNSTVIWLKRDLSLLPIDGRPISQKNTMTELYGKRAPLYEDFSDFSVDVSENAEETAEIILEKLRRM